MFKLASPCNIEFEKLGIGLGTRLATAQIYIYIVCLHYKTQNNNRERGTRD
jgi:hypothetical protein